MSKPAIPRVHRSKSEIDNSIRLLGKRIEEVKGDITSPDLSGYATDSELNSLSNSVGYNTGRIESLEQLDAAKEHNDLSDMADTAGTNVDHDTRYVTKVQTSTPSTPTPFAGMLWWDTDATLSVTSTYPTATKTGTYTITSADAIVLCNGTFTVTLPTAASIGGKVYWIKNIGSGVVTVDGNGSEEIDELTTQTLNQYDSITVTSDGTEWWII